MLKHMQQILKPYIGWTFVDIVHTPNQDAFGLRLKRGERSVVLWVDCDAEANGPGWISPEES